jgi:ribonuclease-3
MVGRNNERLEFLGDRVLGLVISEALMNKYPQADEGELAKRLSALVSRHSCSEIAEQFNMAAPLIHDQQNDNIMLSDNVMANLCEAIIAALYLDGGLEVASKFILKAWAPILDAMKDVPANPKSDLQEYTSREGLGLPSYKLIDTTGPDHAPVITVEVSLDNGTRVSANAGSKKKAEIEAAQSLLEKLITGTGEIS